MNKNGLAELFITRLEFLEKCELDFSLIQTTGRVHLSDKYL